MCCTACSKNQVGVAGVGPMHTGHKRDKCAKMEPGPILLLVACSVNSPVATIGFSCPNLLCFASGVHGAV